MTEAINNDEEWGVPEEEAHPPVTIPADETNLAPQAPDFQPTRFYQLALKNRRSEPGFDFLSEAIRLRTERERTLSTTEFDDYMDSVKKEIEIRAISIRYQVFEIGKLIFNVKQLMARYGFRGEFGKWLDDFPISRSTALNCYRVYMTCMSCPDAVQFFSPSTLYVMTEPKFPPELRAYMMEDRTDPFHRKLSELKELVARYEAGEIEYDGPEMRAFAGNTRTYDVAETVIRELRKVQASLGGHKSTLESLNTEYAARPMLPEEEDQETGHDYYRDAIALVEECTRMVTDRITELGG